MTKKKENRSGFVGQYVIARCTDAGVHAGVLVSHKGQEAHLVRSRRLWYWQSAGGAFLSGVAVDGITDQSKIGAPIDVYLTEVCELIKCSKDARKSISGAAIYAGG